MVLNGCKWTPVEAVERDAAVIVDVLYTNYDNYDILHFRFCFCCAVDLELLRKFAHCTGIRSRGSQELGPARARWTSTLQPSSASSDHTFACDNNY